MCPKRMKQRVNSTLFHKDLSRQEAWYTMTDRRYRLILQGRNEQNNQKLKGDAGIGSRTAVFAPALALWESISNPISRIFRHTHLWISLTLLLMFCKLWSSPLVQVSESGASLTCWRATEMIIRGLMLMVNKEAQQNRTRTVSPAAIPSKANYRVKSKKHL